MSRLGWALNMGLAIAGIATFGQSAAAASPEMSRTITIHVYNYAQVDRKTLSEAERIATEIFRKAGVESYWIDCPLGPENAQANTTEQRPHNLSDFHLNILSREMAQHVPLKGDVMGVAPGTEPGRQAVYVLYSRIETFAARQRMDLAEKIVTRAANEPQILGHVIAHEIGHELLNLEEHSPTGIMRGNWYLDDLQQASCGELLFTLEQAEVIRAEVARRMNTNVAPESARAELPASEHLTLGQ